MLVADIRGHRAKRIRQASEYRARSEIHVAELAVSVTDLVVGRLPEKTLVRVGKLDAVRAALRTPESGGSAELTGRASRIAGVPRRGVSQVILALQGEAGNRW